AGGTVGLSGAAGIGSRWSRSGLGQKAGGSDLSPKNSVDGRSDRPMNDNSRCASSAAAYESSAWNQAMFRSLFQRLAPSTPAKRRQPIRRRLGIETLAKRELLAADLGSVAGTFYIDLAGNGLTP